MIHLSNYKKSYSGRLILEIPELKLDNGIFWIKGVNGSGKSTLFKSIAGIINFEGKCTIDELSIRKQPVEYRTNVNYSEAEPLFPDFLTLKDLAEFVATAKKASNQQLEELKELFGVAEYYENKISSYSSGMLKKVGLLLAFLGQPKVIILDEPFITIDQQSTEKLVQLITQLHQKEGATFLVATHMDTDQSHLPYNKIFIINDTNLIEV